MLLKNLKTYFIFASLILIVFSSLVFANHYYARAYIISFSGDNTSNTSSSGSGSSGTSGTYCYNSSVNRYYNCNTGVYYEYPNYEGSYNYTGSSSTSSSGNYNDSHNVTSGSSGGIQTRTYTDPNTGQTYTYTYDPSTGHYTTQTSSGQTYEYNTKTYSDATYDSKTGTYIKVNSNGDVWSYNPATGAYTLTRVDGTTETGLKSGPGGDTKGEVVITKQGQAYTFDKNVLIEEKYKYVLDNWGKEYGAPPSEEDLKRIRTELEARADAYSKGETAYKDALESRLPVDQVEKELPKQAEATTFQQYIKKLEIKLGRSLTTEDLRTMYARYEEREKELSTKIGETEYFKDNYESQQRSYDSNQIPEQYRIFKDKKSYETMLDWRREFEERVEKGEDNSVLEREFSERFKKQFKEPAMIKAPDIVHPVTMAEQTDKEVKNKYKQQIEILEEQNISLDSGNPVAMQIRRQINAELGEKRTSQQDSVVKFMKANCQGKVGDSQEACEKQVQTTNAMQNQCKKLDGDAQTACYDAVQQVVELDCSGIHNSKGCTQKYNDIKNSVIEKVKNPQTRPVFLHQLEFIREQEISKGLFEEIEKCKHGGANDCDKKSREILEKLLETDKELFDAQYDPLSNNLKEIEARVMEFEEQRSAFNNLVDPAMKESKVPENLLERLNQKEEKRIMLMMEFIEARMKKLLEEGKTEKEVAQEVKNGIYYNCLYEQLMSGAEDFASHRQYKDMAASLQVAQLTFDDFMEWAKKEI